MLHVMPFRDCRSIARSSYMYPYCTFYDVRDLLTLSFQSSEDWMAKEERCRRGSASGVFYFLAVTKVQLLTSCISIPTPDTSDGSATRKAERFL